MTDYLISINASKQGTENKILCEMLIHNNGKYRYIDTLFKTLSICYVQIRAWLFTAVCILVWTDENEYKNLIRKAERQETTWQI